MADDGSQKRKPDFKTAVEDVKALATVLAVEAEAIFGRRTARVLGGLALFAVLVIVLLALLDSYIAPSGADQKKDVIATLAQILAGTALLSGLYFTWRAQQLTQRGQEENQRNTQEQLRLIREGQITERFTKAIDQLGNETRTEIRLGGIYALERIAKESEEDYWPIMEILTEYVRGLSPVAPPHVHPVAQAIMTVIKRRSHYYGHGESERLDLHGAASLPGTNLDGAHLRKADLEGADLRLAKLQAANLQRANLVGAHLEEADLEGADLGGAHLEEVSGLTQGQLEQAFGNEHTRLPDYLRRPEGWRRSADEQLGED